MLTCWDSKIREEVPAGSPVELMLRDSMIKFESSLRAVEVVGYARRNSLLLNRQLILLLENLGVPNEVFVDLQQEVLWRLNDAMGRDGAADALILLHTSGFGSPDARLKSLSPMLDAGALFQSGLNCENCELLYEIMTAFRRRVLRELMTRARIPIGLEDGCVVIGVLDEAKVLEPCEIFLQYSHPVTGEIVVVQGPVVVGRSPCLHAGDLQPLTAVYRPELRHLVDVVVFSQKGKRSLPSMLSGGDLVSLCNFHRLCLDGWAVAVG